MVFPLCQRSFLTINLVQRASASGAPAAFWPAVQATANYLSQLIISPYTIEIQVGWGETNGQSPGGISSSDWGITLDTYANVRAALIANARSVSAAQAVNTLPVSAPVGVSQMLLFEAQQNILGLANNATGYAFIGFNTGVSWVYDGSVPGAGQVDFKGTCLHEMTETLGRVSASGAFGAGIMSVLDLYTYSANGVRNLTGTGTRYFSTDGGATNQRGLGGSGDTGDWTNASTGLYAGTASPFDGSVHTAQLTPLLPCDKLLIDALGCSSR